MKKVLTTIGIRAADTFGKTLIVTRFTFIAMLGCGKQCKKL